MSWIEQIKEALPDYAKDTRLNLDAVITRSTLSEEEATACALAAAIAIGNRNISVVIGDSIENEVEKNAAKAAAVLMAQNNMWYPYVEMTGDANDPVVYGHEKANPMSLKGRIQQARAQLKELAQMAESNDLVTWEQITKLHQGGMFMGLAQNLEQIRHGIEELAAKRSKGGVSSRGIDKNIGEDNDPCWDNYKMVGTKKKGGKTVPNCVPKK